MPYALSPRVSVISYLSLNYEHLNITQWRILYYLLDNITLLFIKFYANEENEDLDP